MKTKNQIVPKYYEIKKSNMIFAIIVGLVAMIASGIAFLKSPQPWNIFGIGIGYGIAVLALEIILNSKKE